MKLVNGQKYQATITLGILEAFATNEMVAMKLQEAGFKNVVVNGASSQRTATGAWGKETMDAKIPSQVSDIKKL